MNADQEKMRHHLIERAIKYCDMKLSTYKKKFEIVNQPFKEQLQILGKFEYYTERKQMFIKETDMRVKMYAVREMMKDEKMWV